MQRHRRVGAELQRRLPHLEPPVDAGETRLGEHHVLQQPLDEVRLASPAPAAPPPPARRRIGGRCAPSSRSIGVPSCVPLVKYTPRSSICWSKRVEAKTSVTNCVERVAQRRHLLREREDPARGAARRAPPRRARTHAGVQPRHQRVELRRERSAASPLSVCSYGNVTPQTCARPSCGRSSKYSVKPATRSHLVTITYTGSWMRSSRLSSSSRRRAASTCALAAARALRHQILRADRQDDAVQRPALAVLPEQREELRPARAVGRRRPSPASCSGRRCRGRPLRR